MVVHPGPFLLGAAFGPGDGDLVVDLIRRRNIKPNLWEVMEPSTEFEGGNLLG